MGINGQPVLSIVLATHNRRAVVSHTLDRLARCGLDREDFEVIVVDNASTDGTGEAVTEQADIVIRLRRNSGSCAKTYGADRARGRYVLFLDDDSHPRGGSLARMIERFEDDPQLGAAGFSVHLPDGRLEGAALPGVFVGCGVGFRAEALRAVGGLDRTFFMQAEEYDLSFRLAGAGWTVKVFDDLHVEHQKTAQARKSERTTYYDVRNNLRVIARYLPSPYARVYREDWLARYAWLAERDGHASSFVRGVSAGRCRGAFDRWSYRPYRLGPTTIELFFRWEYIRSRMVELAEAGVVRVVFADLGKNIFPFHRAACEAGVSVVAIADDRFWAPARRYRDIPIVPLDDGLNRRFDAVVVSNTGPVHAARTLRTVAGLTAQPVHCWFGQLQATSFEARSGVASVLVTRSS